MVEMTIRADQEPISVMHGEVGYCVCLSPNGIDEENIISYRLPDTLSKDFFFEYYYYATKKLFDAIYENDSNDFLALLGKGLLNLDEIECSDDNESTSIHEIETGDTKNENI